VCGESIPTGSRRGRKVLATESSLDDVLTSSKISNTQGTLSFIFIYINICMHVYIYVHKYIYIYEYT
jgi:hypothetical protein